MLDKKLSAELMSGRLHSVITVLMLLTFLIIHTVTVGVIRFRCAAVLFRESVGSPLLPRRT